MLSTTDIHISTIIEQASTLRKTRKSNETFVFKTTYNYVVISNLRLKFNCASYNGRMVS